MSTFKAPKRINKRHEMREDTLLSASDRFFLFFEENRSMVFGTLGVVVLAVLVYIGYGFYMDGRQQDAQVQLADALIAYGDGQYQGALDGMDGRIGLVEVADKFSATKAGNLARFYAGDALFNLGQHEEALSYFQRFKADGNALGAGAKAAEAAIHETLGDFERAGDSYQAAANIYESDETSALYLQKAGRSYEKAGEYSEAREMYEMIRDDYSEASAAGEVDYLLARVNVLDASGN